MGDALERIHEGTRKVIRGVHLVLHDGDRIEDENEWLIKRQAKSYVGYTLYCDRE